MVCEYIINRDNELLPVPLVRLIVDYIGAGHIQLVLADGKCSNTLAWKIGCDGDLIAMEEIPDIGGEHGQTSFERRACVIVGGIESGDSRLTAMGMDIPTSVAIAATKFGDFDFVKRIAKTVGLNGRLDSEFPLICSAASDAIKNGNVILAETWIRHYALYTPYAVDRAFNSAIKYKYPEMLDIFVRLGHASWSHVASRAFSARCNHALEHAVQNDPSALNETLKATHTDMIQHSIHYGGYSEKICAIMRDYLYKRG